MARDRLIANQLDESSLPKGCQDPDNAKEAKLTKDILRVGKNLERETYKFKKKRT